MQSSLFIPPPGLIYCCKSETERRNILQLFSECLEAIKTALIRKGARPGEDFRLFISQGMAMPLSFIFDERFKAPFHSALVKACEESGWERVIVNFMDMGHYALPKSGTSGSHDDPRGIMVKLGNLRRGC